MPVTDVKVGRAGSSNLGHEESVEEKQELSADQEALDIWSLEAKFECLVCSWVRVLVQFEINILKADDRDLASFEKRNPKHHQEKECNLKDWVAVGLTPRRIVPLFADTVDVHDHREDRERS